VFKHSYHVSYLFLVFFLLGTTVWANANISDDRVWRETKDTGFKQRTGERTINPAFYKTYRINKRTLRRVLDQAPLEFTDAARNSEIILHFPMPNGSFERFRIVESPIVEPELLEKFPELKTYSGQGIDDATAIARFDFLPGGFHSQILSAKGTILIDPYFKQGDTENYISYYKNTVTPTQDFTCHFDKNNKFPSLLETVKTQSFSRPIINGQTLKTYRLALAATGEYTAFFGGTVAGALAAQVTAMNRINGVYERELAMRMVILGNNNLLIYTNPATDPYTNTDSFAMRDENQANTDIVIGSENYDIGHVFGTGTAGGVATLNSPCTFRKARTATGIPNPVGDPFVIDFVAHEIGHQWGANHTFNGSAELCNSVNRSNINTYEVGSGITIMSYSGICGNQNLGTVSLDNYHVKSLEIIVDFSNNSPCTQATTTGNTPPTVTLPLGSTFNIPKQTPFSLTAAATDPDGDSLTYDWQEYDLAGAVGATNTVPNSDADGIARPIFRNYLPTTENTRFFPSLQYIRNNANLPPPTTGGFLTGELLPAITRTMTFQVVVRDNRAGSGAINSATATVNVDGNSGPFNVTSPNTSVVWAGKSTQIVTWNVAHTNLTPVNAVNVKILFSSDGGLTFPTTILAGTPNDGTQTIIVPNVATTQGRIKVEGENNIFFDMSDVNFSVNAVAAAVRAPFDFDGDGKTDVSIFRSMDDTWWYSRSSDLNVFAARFGNSSGQLTPADFTGDSKTDIAVWQPSTGEWFILRSEDSSFFSFPFGALGDIPAPADFDGDGRTDAAVFRPSSGTWFILNSSGSGTSIVNFGSAEDKPVPADFDGDSRSDIAIFRPADGSWWYLQSSNLQFKAYLFGVGTDKPVQGDYTGDGRADIAVFRPETGEWFVQRSEDNSYYSNPFGTLGDIAAPGDYDGDGRFDTAVFRPSTANWFVQLSTAGIMIQRFGLSTDTPVPNAFVR